MLAASHLAYQYGRRRWGLFDGHFSVGGPVVGVLGPAGAGKSTLLALLTAAKVATAPTRGGAGRLPPAARRGRGVRMRPAVRVLRTELASPAGLVALAAGLMRPPPPTEK